MREPLQLEDFKEKEESQDVHKLKITKNLSNVSGDVGELHGDTREVGGGIVTEGNIEVASHNNDNGGDGMMELREKDRNGPPTPT